MRAFFDIVSLVDQTDTGHIVEQVSLLRSTGFAVIFLVADKAGSGEGSCWGSWQRSRAWLEEKGLVRVDMMELKPPVLLCPNHIWLTRQLKRYPLGLITFFISPNELTISTINRQHPGVKTFSSVADAVQRLPSEILEELEATGD